MKFRISYVYLNVILIKVNVVRLKIFKNAVWKRSSYWRIGIKIKWVIVSVIRR